MTNFEKWRDSLTPELVQDAFDGFLNGEPCRHCPAIGLCLGIDGCKEKFLRWASAPAKEASK